VCRTVRKSVFVLEIDQLYTVYCCGMLVQYAIRNVESEPVLLFWITTYPETIKVMSKDLLDLLHDARESNRSEKLVHVLYEAYREAV
jgi:hypothetical protein